MQARRAERPCSRPYATCRRRAGTLTSFCRDFLHHLDFEIALGHQLLQPRILRFELPQALDVVRLKTSETLAPSVDRLLADAVPLGHR